VGPGFVVFAKELTGNRAAEENSCFSVGGLGVEVTIAKGAGKIMDGGLGEGGTAGAVQEGVEFVTHDFVGGDKRGNSVGHTG